MVDGDPIESRRARAEWLLAAGSLLAMVLLAGLGELAVRLFSSVDLLGNSKDLFVAGAFGESYGNRPSAEESSFGRPVYTDEHGFRVPKGGVPGDAARSRAILIVGDSVGFGPAVDEEQTFAGLLRARFPDRRIYNASAIGYNTPDYRNVIDAFLPAHPEVEAVVVLYCLNDITAITSRNIDRYLRQPELVPEQGLTEKLRSFSFLSDANDFLRSRSKLYLFVRHNLLHTQYRDWRIVLQLFGDEHVAEIDSEASQLAEIAKRVRDRGLPFVLVLSPFEYQLRAPDDPDANVPQRKLGERLARAGVAYIDPRPAFDPKRASTDYFLAYDSMHLSPAGHRVIADVIADALVRSGADAQ